MNASVAGSRNRKLGLIAAVIAALAFVVVAVVLQRIRSPHGPKLLNLPTKAREATPFTREPDPRFEPLPEEPEKHEH